MTAGTVGPAVQAAGEALIGLLATIGTELRSGPLSGLDKSQARGEAGAVVIGAARMSYTDILAGGGRAYAEERGSAAPGHEMQQYSMFAFGANFVEVEVDPITMWARVSNVVGTYASGRILNPLTARSQIIGGITFAIGSAMCEHALRDVRDGRWISDDFGVYHVPAQADVPPITVEFIPEEDRHTNPLGTKGLGELGGVGLNAAIAHALYHASGTTRLHHLPYYPESLLGNVT